MKRREFIAASALLALSPAVNSLSLEDTNTQNLLVLDEVLTILFPKTPTMPSAKEFGAINYFISAFKSTYFPKEDKEYILIGAKDFLSSFPDFLQARQKTKEKYVSDASQSSYGSSWLDTLVYYGIEAMLSDPIYDGNKDKIAWKSLKHQEGQPRPKTKYAKVL